MNRPKMKISVLLIAAFAFVSNLSLASEEPNHHNEADVHAQSHVVGDHDHDSHHLVDKAEFGTDYLLDHVLDSYDWHIMDWPAKDENGNRIEGKYEPITFSLPIILVDDGLKVFWSGKFNHGHTVAEYEGNHYFIYNHKIYSTDNNGTMTFSVPVEEDENLENQGGEPTSAEPQFETVKTTFTKYMHGDFLIPEGATLLNTKPWDFSITKSVIALLVTVFLMILIFFRASSFYRKNGALVAPKGIAGFVEPIIVFVRDDIAVPNIGEKKYMRYMPYLLTVFFFIWITNLVGLFPLGFNLTGNIACTFVLAMFTMILTNFSGNKNYWGHIFWMPGIPVPMKIFLAPIELVGVIAKPFALMIRLFANITAGHIVVMSLIGLIFANESLGWAGMSVPMTLFILVLELLVAALQAYVFTMLSALFIGSAVEEAHH